ncbi:MAG: oligosaccharide flippase family protein [Pseudomonadota bacterium]
MANNRTFSTFASALITVAMNWTDRLIGLISMIVLARLLVPDDFGIIAMAALVMAFADVILNLGVHVPLIQNQDATNEHYDTAWTIRLIQTVVSTIALFLLAPAAAEFFDDARVEPVLQVLAFSLVIGGLENIGTVDFQKKMQFGAEFKYKFLRRFLGFLVIMICAMVLRTYWALVIGMIAERVITVILSYVMSPMRPRLAISRFREIFGVSQWMLLYNIGRYLNLKLHRIIVGRWESAGVLGAYTIAGDIAQLPTSELISPINRALFPSFAKVKTSEKKLKRQFLLAQGVQTLVAVPAAVGLALVAAEAVPFMLGQKWLSAVPFVQVLALINIAQALSTSGFYVLLAVGKTRINAVFVWLQVVMFGGLAFTSIIDRNAIELSYLLFGVSLAALWIQFWLVTRHVPLLGISDILRESARPLVAALAMTAALRSLPEFIVSANVTVLLVAKVAIGAIVYVGTLFALWHALGRPAGAENYIIEKTRGIWRPILSRLSRA